MKAMSLFVLFLLAGCSASLEDIDPDTVSPKTAYHRCRLEAQKCFDVPAVVAEAVEGCANIYYYTGNSTQIFEYTKSLCPEDQ